MKHFFLVLVVVVFSVVSRVQSAGIKLDAEAPGKFETSQESFSQKITVLGSGRTPEGSFGDDKGIRGTYKFVRDDGKTSGTRVLEMTFSLAQPVDYYGVVMVDGGTIDVRKQINLPPPGEKITTTTLPSNPGSENDGSKRGGQEGENEEEEEIFVHPPPSREELDDYYLNIEDLENLFGPENWDGATGSDNEQPIDTRRNAGRRLEDKIESAIEIIFKRKNVEVQKFSHVDLIKLLSDNPKYKDIKAMSGLYPGGEHPGRRDSSPPGPPGRGDSSPPRLPGRGDSSPPRLPGRGDSSPPRLPGNTGPLPPGHSGNTGPLPPGHSGNTGPLPPRLPGRGDSSPPRLPVRRDSSPPGPPGHPGNMGPEKEIYMAYFNFICSSPDCWFDEVVTRVVGNRLALFDKQMFGILGQSPTSTPGPEIPSANSTATDSTGSTEEGLSTASIVGIVTGSLTGTAGLSSAAGYAFKLFRRKEQAVIIQQAVPGAAAV